MKNGKVIVDVWNGCYPSNWSGMIVPDAMKHPAKFSSKLIRRIYQHMFQEQWLRPGDYVLDPFGGVALGALDAMRAGLRWRGVELEERFYVLGGLNISFWKKRFQTMPGWSGDAILYHGDSRKLLEAIFKTQGVVSSPPYSNSMNKPNGIDASKLRGNKPGKNSQALLDPRYSAGGVVSSPPYAEARIGRESGKGQAGHGDQYGDTDGQLGAMPAQNFDAAVASPPFRQTSGGTPEPKQGGVINRSAILRHAAGNRGAKGYGETDGQLANEKEDDFWLAARAVVGQVYLALAPGGHAVWVCKDFVQNHERVPFCDRWRQLCEAVGFTTVHEHHASLVREKGSSQTLEGGTVRHKTESKSLFRRIAENKGAPRIDFEVVFCMVKPE
jgi:hypothetical protein